MIKKANTVMPEGLVVRDMGAGGGGERKRERRKKLVFIIFFQLLEHQCLGIAVINVQTGPITAHYKKNQSFGSSSFYLLSKQKQYFN